MQIKPKLWEDEMSNSPRRVIYLRFTIPTQNSFFVREAVHLPAFLADEALKLGIPVGSDQTGLPPGFLLQDEGKDPAQFQKMCSGLSLFKKSSSWLLIGY